MGLRERVTDALDLPKDLALGAIIITITGRCEAYVENYMSLIEYTEELIRVGSRTCTVELHGERLDIAYYTSDEMKITGDITEVKYC